MRMQCILICMADFYHVCLYIFCNLIYFQGVSMAPVWDSSKGKFVGVLSAMDIIQIIKEVCGDFW